MTKLDPLNIREAGIAAAGAAKESMQDFGQSVSTRFDELKDSSAGALHSGAGSVRDATHRSTAAINRAGEDVADRMDAASNYVGSFDAVSLGGTLRRAVRHNPGSFLIMATVFGFCVGSAVYRGRNGANGVQA